MELEPRRKERKSKVKLPKDACPKDLTKPHDWALKGSSEAWWVNNQGPVSRFREMYCRRCGQKRWGKRT
jgi:hypothetical protein